MSSPLFALPEIKKAFGEYEQEQKIRLYKLACWFTAIGMPAGISLDMNIYPGETAYFLKLRILSSVLVLILFGLFYTAMGFRYYRVLCLILPLVPQGVISWMIYKTEGSVSPYYAGLCLILLAFCLLLPWSFQETMALAVATLVFYATACVAHGGETFHGIFFSNFYFLFMTALFATIGSYFTSRLRIREFTLRFELDQNKRMLEESNQKLVELDQMKSRFFANISHELRTPLTLLISPLETLQREKAELLDEESKGILQIMFSNAMRLLKLINDLLDLVKLESGRIEIKQEAIDLKEFVHGLTQSIQNTAKDKRVRLSAKVDEPVKRVMADRDKLEKIILNLLFNALKFTPAGGRVELTAQKEDTQLVIQVRDTGMGISEDNLPHIFDRFWQADSNSNRKYQGTGIGLALVKELVEAQGGTVGVESQLSQGTTMTIRLPYIEAVESMKPIEKIGANEKTAEPDEWLAGLYRRAELFPTLTPVSATMPLDNYARGKKPRLLLADDEPDILRFLKLQLEKNYEIIESVDGNQAVAKAKQFLPDLALLDMMMPEKDGIEACREIKLNFSTQSIPVILLTARADDETKLAALNAGASDFLTKPFSTTELHTRIKNLVDSHHFQFELARQNQRLESAMEQLKDTEATLVQTEKMSSLGRMSAGMIHEINNPLNYALAALNVLKSMRGKWPEAEKAKIDDLLSDMHEGMARVQTIVSDLRGFTHPHGRAADLIELDEVISIALRFLGHEIDQEVSIKVDVPKGQRVAAEKNNLTHVFINLFQNAVDAMKARKDDGEKGTLSIQSEADGEKVKVWVKDNGIGISPEHVDKIFDPFFTTKDVGAGMGLGLSICYRIMAEQGGKISVKSEPGQFTEFLLELPLKITRSGS
jgi:signal transduction histidine kinase